MPEVLPYAAPDPRQRRDDHYQLKVLAVCHDVLGSLTLFSGFVALAATGAADSAILVLIGLGLAIVLSGVCIHKLKLRGLSVFIAAILCVVFPFGTLLGIFTIAVLSRATVIGLYIAAR
jgi:hypothetical protein